MKERIQRLHSWLSQQQDAMVDLLRDVVNIDSNSHDKAGVDAVGARFVAFLRDNGISTETISVAAAGDVLISRLGPSEHGQKPIILLGHRDTVFPTGEVARRPFSIVDGTAYGPGVCDMKGGLVQNAFVLAAFRYACDAPPPLMLMMTSDEEIGSPYCREIIVEQARGARAVFNSEPARPTGNVVTDRRGGMALELTIEGRAAHSGGNFTEGISAIEELARKISALHALTDVEAGYTVNVGVVAGGQSHNTVAPDASALIDCRFVTHQQRDALKKNIDEIVARNFVQGTRSTLKVKAQFDPMVANDGTRELLRAYQASAAEFGLAVQGEFSGGCADSGFTHNAGCPSLCGLGPMGWKAHTPQEYLLIDSLVQRAQILAGAVARVCWQTDLSASR